MRIKGIQLRVSKDRCASAGSCTTVAIVITFLYVTVFAKYAYFTLGSDIEEEYFFHELRNAQSDSSKYCKRFPESLVGGFHVDTYDPASFEQTVQANPNVHNGGAWAPTNCIPRQKLAIIIPYRDRLRHLQCLLSYLHPMLQKQNRDYRIYVIEQYSNDTFNKARIMNIAFNEARKDAEYDCFIFHDVDMIPQNDRNLYECGPNPRHLSPALDEMRYTLMYSNLVGGVLALTKDQVLATNGYSNMYWGWGGEDDDMSMRIQGTGYKISRPSSYIGRYKMVQHKKRELGHDRLTLFADWQRWPHDGINSLESLDYSILTNHPHQLYTNITVDIGPSPKTVYPEKQTVVQMVLNFAYFFVNV